MSTAGDSADELVKICLDGTEVAFKIAGEGAKNIGAVLLAIMKDVKQTKGKTRLTNMLKSGKNLKIYSFRAEDLKKFSQEAKRYGVLYSVLAHKKNEKIDGIVDVMIREEDAVKVNRIAERFEFANVDKAMIARDLGLDKDDQNLIDLGFQEKSKEDILIDELLSKPIQKEEQQIDKEINFPSKKNTEEKNQSEISSDTKQKKNEKNKDTKKEDKKSVREELNEIVLEIKAQELQKEKSVPKHLKEKSDKKVTKGKRYKSPKHLKMDSKKKER